MLLTFMVSGNEMSRQRAVLMLTIATLFWGLSFPLMKSLSMEQQNRLSGASSWFISASATTVRFAVAAMLMLIWRGKALGRIRWLEVWQGAGLGVFGGLGLLFQMDGLVYTSASTSAFLTSSYCVFLPLWAACWQRRRPSVRLWVSTLFVVAGVAILARVDWGSLTMGRGEWETLIGSLLFAGQILWLERPIFARNRVEPITTVMFATIGLLMFPVSVWTARQAADWVYAYRSWGSAGLIAGLVLGCTIVPYVLMNRWQPRVTATEAGLIYCAEPVFASLFALFLPGWVSAASGLKYPNELLTWNLMMGGGIILLANLLLQSRSFAAVPDLHPESSAPPLNASNRGG